MHLAIDGTIWGGKETGVAVSTRRLIYRFVQLHPEHQFTVFLTDEAVGAEFQDASNVELVRGGWRKGGGRVCWQQLWLPRMLSRYSADMLYCPCYTVPVFSPLPTIVTVHDLIALKRPGVCHPANALHMWTMLGHSIRRAACVTAPTRAVADDILDRFKVPEEKIHVVPWAADSEIEPTERSQAEQIVQDRFGITTPFILFAGKLERKKNVAQVLQAATKLDVPLVVTGSHGWGERNSRSITQGEADSLCRFLGYVSPAELSLLYSAATVFAFPSLIEGFGLPVLEAMTCGAPVVTSNAPALVEVCGGAAIHVPATDLPQFVASVRSVIEDPSLASELRTKGFQRALDFSWDRSAHAFSESVQKVAGGKPARRKLYDPGSSGSSIVPIESHQQ